MVKPGATKDLYKYDLNAKMVGAEILGSALLLLDWDARSRRILPLGSWVDRRT